MDASGIISAINLHLPLEEKESLYFSSLLIPARVKQGEFIEKAGEITRYFIHVQSGCLMTYYTDRDGTDHVIQFSTAGWWTGDLHSFTKQTPSSYSTRALAESEVFYLPKDDMDQLLERYPKFERYFRILFQNSLVTHQERIIQNFADTAEDRYEQFRKKYPSLEQFVPQKYIASYLGITPEFLSKIRKRLTER